MRPQKGQQKDHRIGYTHTHTHIKEAIFLKKKRGMERGRGREGGKEGGN